MISTYSLYEDGFYTIFSDRVSIIKNDKEIHQGLAVKGRYVLYPKALVKPPEKEEKLSKNSIIRNHTFLWYYRLGHMILEEMIDLNNYTILHYRGDL